MKPTGEAGDPLAPFSSPVAEWFRTTFGTATPPQSQGWPAIAKGDHTLILAPTGSGKTLAAFLWGLDQLVTTPPPEDRNRRTRILYLSPLRALAVDVEKNLRAPLAGIELAAERLDLPFHPPTVGMRTGDTSSQDRRRMIRHPPDLLITTPESLYLLLTSQARETLQGIEAVIIDEIHAMAASKRGAHLALSLERLDAVTDRPVQRIGLSATQRPLEEVARFLGGFSPGSGPDRAPRAVTIVDAGVRKLLDLEVIVPVDDMGALGELTDAPSDANGEAANPYAVAPVRRSIWPSMHPRLLELIHEHRSTLIFVNARRLAERLATRLNELELEGVSRAAEADGTSPPEPEHALVKAHHGSLSREQRLQIEDELKRGDLRALVCTSSLELGIDMGAVDLVIQVESPRRVSSGLQRVGRAGHQVGEPSRGKLFPKHRADLVEAAVVVQRMRDGLIEHTRYLRNPLDVLAQQIVAMCAMDDWPLADLAALVRGSATFADISDDVLHNVLDLLAGRYPSDEFSELRPRLVWDRVDDVVRGRAGSQRLAVTSGGTIPDRGLYGVFLPDGARVGELDEEMVYESRPGETFLLGASTWRIEDITHDRVIVTPAPGMPGKMPFWHGEGPGRPLELGQAVGAFQREIRQLSPEGAHERLRTIHGLDERAANNLVAYLDEQAEATGVVPDDRTIVVERFKDEIGDWRICILSPFGAQVHAPWAIALRVKLGERLGSEPELMWSDDGIVLRLPDGVDELPIEELLVRPEEVDELVIGHLHTTALFTSRFREAASRALLLPRRNPGRRTPLWQQRQKAANLLQVAVRYPDFPLLLEATRECVNDVFDLPALRHVLASLENRTIRLTAVDTKKASPFAQSLLFGWVAVYMYDYDSPVAERRATALSLDKDLLRELLGSEELRELIDADVLADLELELQRLADGRRARDADELHDLLRVLGPLDRWELDARAEAESADVQAWIAGLVAERRAMVIHVAGEERIAASDDAARLRDALGVALPPGLPAAYTMSVDDPLGDLVARFARTHGPFVTEQVAARYGVSPARVTPVLARLEAADRLVLGEFRPGGVSREWCDADVLRQLRRRSLAALRREVEPVDGVALARFLPAWQGISSPPRSGPDVLVDAIGSLQGTAIPASVLETDVLPVRVDRYQPSMLDELLARGEVVWTGAGGIGANDGRIRLFFRDQIGLLLPDNGVSFGVPAPGTDSDSGPALDPASDPGSVVPTSPPGAEADGYAPALRECLHTRGAVFWPDLVAAAQAADLPYDDGSVLAALWDLVWSGEVTNDSLAPLRAMVASARGRGTRRSSPASRGTGSRGTGGRGTGGRGTGGRGAAARSGLGPRPNLSRGALRAGARAAAGTTRLGPPAAAGRWSLVAPLLRPPASTTEVAHARALQLLERHGVVTREGVLAEGTHGGYAGIYPMLKVLEEQGHVRRGYFVAGLGAAQFALPGAVDRLRHQRDQRDEERFVLTLAATDPAQPYGAALSWPPGAVDPATLAVSARPARRAGSQVVLIDGDVVAYLEKGGRSLVTFPPDAGRLNAADDRDSEKRYGDHIAAALVSLVRSGRLNKIEIGKVDGRPINEAPVELVAALRRAGFADGYRGLLLRG